MNPQSSKKKEKSANHLLHFRFAERKPVETFIRRPSVVIPFKKERFLQANYRFIVSNTGDYTENIADPDLLVDWDNVEQVYFSTLTPYNCPICLDTCVVSKVAKCGHVFCLPCIIRHFSYNNSKKNGKCPICFAFVSLKDLKSVVIETLVDYTEGTTVEFVLMKRSKNSAISLPRSRWNARTELFPHAEDVDSIFTRLSITNDITNILRREQQELQEAAKEAISCGDDSLPFIIEAQETLLEKASLNQELSQQGIIKPILPLKSAMTIQTPTSRREFNRSQIQDEFDEQNFFYNYQSKDGQLLFLHPLNMKILVRQYGSYENLPDIIAGEIIERETFIQTEASRKRYKALSHIPLSSQFLFVEIKLSDIPKEALQPFREEIQKRSDRRLRQKMKQKEEREQELISKIPKVLDYDEQNFPSPPSSNLIEIDEHELEEAIKLSLKEEGKLSIKNEEEDHSLQTTNSNILQIQKESPKQNSPSFLEVLKAPEKPPQNVPMRKTKKGKEYLILSTANYRRSLI